MAVSRASARWRPPSSRRSLTWYRWTAWTRLLLVTAFALATISNLAHGGSIVPAVLILFVVAFVASTEIWKLQGIHAIVRERSHGDAEDQALLPRD